MKLWQNRSDIHADVERFTIGADRDFDLLLAPFDILGSIAHVRMLGKAGLLTPEECTALVRALQALYYQTQEGTFTIDPETEDVHSQVELMLTRQLGEIGKKIHSGRSRNDQVLTDIRMFIRHEIESLITQVNRLFRLLLQKADQYKDVLIPGYTHSQPAMPSSFGLWFSAYAESLVDDVCMLEAAYRIINRNPLGSAAGYGSSFPLDRKLTTALLGFDDLVYNVVYAQMGRGKTERIVAVALAGFGATLVRLASDVILFVNPQFGFLRLPDELTTGSSIMPHKKNPDVFELIRAHANALQALPNTIHMITTNLISGYHRDYQILKEYLFPSFRTLSDCLQMTELMLSSADVCTDVLKSGQFDTIFSVEEVNRLVLGGVPFREAYRQVKEEIQKGTFRPVKNIHHTHEGSIGNLCLEEIKSIMEAIISRFDFHKVHAALAGLLKEE
jgi:argininosuccinate lyase